MLSIITYLSAVIMLCAIMQNINVLQIIAFQTIVCSRLPCCEIQITELYVFVLINIT